MKSKKDTKTIPVSTRITKSMHNAVLRLVGADSHLNVADYLRDLIRRDLENRGVSFE